MTLAILTEFVRTFVRTWLQLLMVVVFLLVLRGRVATLANPSLQNVDLAKAYRQLARRSSHSCFGVVGSWSPTAGCTQYFVQSALAFGSSASVLNFNWCSAALCLRLNRLLWVSCTNYYDDFCAFEFQALVESTSSCVSEFFDLLGWSLKDLPCFGQAPSLWDVLSICGMLTVV